MFTFSNVLLQRVLSAVALWSRVLLGVGIGAVRWGDGGPLGRPTHVDVPSGAPGKQGQQHDLDCTDGHIKHGKLNTQNKHSDRRFLEW